MLLPGAERERQKKLGLIRDGWPLTPRSPFENHFKREHGVNPAWDTLPADRQADLARRMAVYAAMVDRMDRTIGRVIDDLRKNGDLDDTLILIMSDNGASQEGGPFGMVNAMGPYNLKREPLEEKIARIDDIGGPDTHSNFPLGWAMAANTPLRRYKQNTHGGGIRYPITQFMEYAAKLPSRYMEANRVWDAEKGRAPY